MNHFLLKLKFDTAVHFGSSDSALALYTSEETFRADTFFSALYIAALAVTEKRAAELLADVRNDEVTFSDAFPWKGNTFYLPKPYLATPPAQNDDSQKENVRRRKAIKKIQWIPAGQMPAYLKERENPAYVPEQPPKFGQAYEQARVSAARTADEPPKPYQVGLYRFYEDCGLYVLLACKNKQKAESVRDLAALVGVDGIGGKRSAGCGKFRVELLPLDDCQEMRWMKKALGRKKGPYLLLTTALPKEDEMAKALEDASCQLCRRGGFAFTEAVQTPKKKKTQWFISSGAVMKNMWSGDVYDVGIAMPQNQSVYRYGKPMFVGVTL